MAIAERIVGYNVRVGESNLTDNARTIQLKLEYGSTVTITFPEQRPADWLQFAPFSISIAMTRQEFADVYHLLQTEDPVFCTALDLFGIQVGVVHTELDLSLGEPTGEGYQDGSLEALVVRARKDAAAGAESPEPAQP